LECRVVNGSTTKTIEFVRQMFDFNGNVLSNSAGSVITLGPLEASKASTDNPSARYCIVTLLSGSKRKVRVSISIADSDGTVLTALEGRP
jgi:hypothetical protein